MVWGGELAVWAGHHGVGQAMEEEKSSRACHKSVDRPWVCPVRVFPLFPHREASSPDLFPLLGSDLLAFSCLYVSAAGMME